MNLVVNARDAMADGGRLVLSTRDTHLDPDRLSGGVTADPDMCGPVRAKPGFYVCLTVADTGHGMDRQTLERIFEPFFTTKQKTAGTGLGLATVYGIVSSHSGFIDCHSVPAKGTRFEIYIPTFPAKASPPAPPARQSADLPGGDETILLVDDEAVLLELGTEILEDFGYAVMCAHSGEEALAIYADAGGRIDLVILDVNMPGIGGHKCLRELLKIDPRAAVLVSTGYADKEVAQRVIAAGAKGFVGKPYPLQEMLVRVRAVLDSHAGVTI